MVNNTMVKVKLHSVLKSGESTNLSIAWSYPVTDRSMFLLSWEGYEYFPEENKNIENQNKSSKVKISASDNTTETNAKDFSSGP